MYLLALVGCNLSQVEKNEVDLGQYFEQNWAKKPFWDDGKAEVAKYSATRIVYGKKRSYEYTYILVKEVFNKEYQVKTDDYSRDDLFPVMKVNKFCSFETKAYPYHYLTSLFFKQEQPFTTHKLTNTSQEWCGNTAKSFLKKDKHYLYEYMSYWDGQGNGSMKIDQVPLFEDQLSYSLRSLKFEDGLNFAVKIYPSQINSKASKPIAENTSISVSVAEPADLANINVKIEKPWKVAVNKGNDTFTNYWFNGIYPNDLLKMEASDGRSLQLDSIYREAYWAKE